MKKNILLWSIILLAIVIRISNMFMCDVNDRGQVALGVTANLPPLQHWISVPFYYITNNNGFAPLYVNIILDVIVLILLYDLGINLVGSGFGKLMSLLYAIFPIVILNARWVSPETTETFFVVLIIYFFAKLEIFGKNTFINKLLFYLSVVIGCFAKQQTILIVIPIIVYGLFKYKLNVYKKQNYWILLLGCLPYLFFLLTHPEMVAATLVIYFGQPVLTGGFIHKVIIFVSNIVYYALIPTIFSIIFFIFIRKNSNRANTLMIIILIFYTVFVFVTMPYLHLLVLPLVFFSAMLLNTIKNKTLLTFIISICIVITFMLVVIPIPHFSILSYTKCDVNYVGGYPQVMTFFNKMDNKTDNYVYVFWNKNKEYFDKLLENETTVIVAGNIGQDVKYNIHKIVRLPSIINTDEIYNIHYGFFFYPLNITYQGVKAWDSEYSNYIVNNSELIFSTNMSTIRYVEIRKFNLTKLDYNKSLSYVINKSRESLGFKR